MGKKINHSALILIAIQLLNYASIIVVLYKEQVKIILLAKYSIYKILTIKLVSFFFSILIKRVLVESIESKVFLVKAMFLYQSSKDIVNL